MDDKLICLWVLGFVLIIIYGVIEIDRGFKIQIRYHLMGTAVIAFVALFFYRLFTTGIQP